MRRLLLFSAIFLTGCAAPKEDFSFRKTQLFVHDTQLARQQKGGHAMIDFERERMDFGTVTAAEREAKEGHYLNFWWRARRTADITVRLEYRQQNTGDRVHVQEVKIAQARGTVETRFRVMGDEYRKGGRIIAWRARLLKDGEAVAETRSFLWE